jgi:hypothetical protein
MKFYRFEENIYCFDNNQSSELVCFNYTVPMLIYLHRSYTVCLAKVRMGQYLFATPARLCYCSPSLPEKSHVSL